MHSEPQKTLEELWIRINDSDNKLLAVRKGKTLLVITSEDFGYADQEKNIFMSGLATSNRELTINMSTTDKSMECTTMTFDKTG